MTQLTVGIIGCGRMGRERARCAQASGAHVVGVFDADPARAAQATAEYGGRPVSDPHELLGCDALFLCTPPDSRPSLALAAVRAGIPFFAEKPIAVRHTDAIAVRDELTDRPVINAVGYMNRWRASVQHARRTLQGRRILGITAHWVNRAYTVPWWLDVRSSGGPHNEQATHLFDLARHLCGEIEQVVSLPASPQGSMPPLGMSTSLRFESGALGSIFYSCEASAKDIGARVFTTEGTIAFATWDLALVENTIDATFPRAEAEDVFLTETRAFLDAVGTGQPNRIAADWADACRTQRAIDDTATPITAAMSRQGAITGH